MIVFNYKRKLPKHWLLGKYLNNGNEHYVYDKGNGYVYKILYNFEFDGLLDWLEIVFKHVTSRNSISDQLPIKFVGVVIGFCRIWPIYKLLKATSKAPENYTELLEKQKPGFYNDPDIYDIRRSNLAMVGDKIVGIDLRYNPNNPKSEFYQ